MKAESPGGNVFVVAAPSGAGKTSLVHALMQRMPSLALSVSHTTRPPRAGEVEGQHYHFVTNSEFHALVANDAFLEHADVFGNGYGTSLRSVEEALHSGYDVILEIDWQGAQQVSQRMPLAIGIFILPPSSVALASRLRGRGKDSEAVIAGRLAKAKEEMSHYGEFDYLVINDDFETALSDLVAIVRANRLRMTTQRLRHRSLIRDLVGAD